MFLSIAAIYWYKAGIIALICCVLWSLFRDDVWKHLERSVGVKHDYKIYNFVNWSFWVGWVFVLLTLFGFIINF
jgi:hypothetical protein